LIRARERERGLNFSLSSSPMQLHIQFLSGMSFTMDTAFHHLRVLEVKKKIEQEMAVPQDELRLLKDGELLKDAFLLTVEGILQLTAVRQARPADWDKWMQFFTSYRYETRLHEVPAAVLLDRDSALAAVMKRPASGRLTYYQLLDDDLKSDWAIALAAVRSFGGSLEFAPDAFRGNRDLVLEAVRSPFPGCCLQFASPALRDDYEIVKVACMSSPWAFSFGSARCQRDEDLAKIAVRRSGYFLEHLNADLRSNRSVVHAAITVAGHALQFASDALKNDFETVLRAVSQKGTSLQFASTALKDDINIVRRATKQDAVSLKFASESMRDDSSIVAIAVRTNFAALSYASARLKADKTIVSAAIAQNASALRLAADEIKDNSEICLKAIAKDPRAIAYVGSELASSTAFARSAFYTNRDSFGFLTASLDIDDDIVNIAVQDASSVSSEPDREAALVAVRQDGASLLCFPEFVADRAVVLEAVRQNGMALQFSNMVENREIVLSAVCENGMALQFASHDLRRDREVVLAALQNNPRAIRFAIDRPRFSVEQNQDSNYVEKPKREKGKRPRKFERHCPQQQRSRKHG
jgi:hypothetical protein